MRAIRLLLAATALAVLPECAWGQGTLETGPPGLFVFRNDFAPTRLWSLDGPLAGRGIWAQMLAGVSPDNLVPVGMAAEHSTNGYVYGGIVEVPDIPPCQIAYVKMVAWDGRLWGNSLAGVAAEQLGMTDTVRVYLASQGPPCEAIAHPFFRQSAIVPIPEPSVAALAISGAAALVFIRRVRQRPSGASGL